MIHCKNLTVYRDTTAILKAFSLDIHQGEHVAILGPNGAGKSTFLRLLTRDLYPAYLPESEFSLFDQTLWNIFELRHKLGILSLELQRDMPKTLKVKEIVLTGFQGIMSVRGMRKLSLDELALADKIIKRTGLEAILKKKFDALSSGEQRRTLLARALVNQPQLLIFDEPTANLDIQMSNDYLKIIREELVRGTTIVMVTHHINEIPPEIKRVIFMKSGRVIADGPKEKLLTNKSLSALFNTPVKVRKYGGNYSCFPVE